jgi:hypothetical protein
VKHSENGKITDKNYNVLHKYLVPEFSGEKHEAFEKFFWKMLDAKECIPSHPKL